MFRQIAFLVVYLAGTIAWAARPTVALLTDFGLNNEAVGLCHGAIARINSDVNVVDLCHTVDAYDIGLAALMIRGTTVFPQGTAIVCVVDPGVGTRREPIAIKTRRGLIYVGPNNGLFTYVAREQGIEQAVVIEPARVNPQWKPGTFDGRDLFSPAGAMLASGAGLDSLGSTMDMSTFIRLPIPQAQVDPARKEVLGTYVRTDEPYGNVWTNIIGDALTSAGISLQDQVEVQVGTAKLRMPFVVSFGAVEEGQPLAYLNSSGTLAVALNMGDFRKKYNLKPGVPFTVRKVAAPPSEPGRPKK